MLNVLYAISLIIWLVGLPFTLLFLDSLHSGAIKNAMLALDNIMVFNYLSYPVVLLISYTLNKKYKLLWIKLLPLVNIIIFLIPFFYYSTLNSFK